MNAHQAAAHLAVCRAVVAATDQSILTTSRLVTALFAAAEFYAAECGRLEAVSRLDVEHLNALGRTIGELRDMMPGVAVNPAPGADEAYPDCMIRDAERATAAQAVAAGGAVMSKVRAVQASMFPDIQPDKPIGRILPSVFVGTNADLMAAVAPFYLTGSVLDVTYGEGKWWDRFKPDPFTAHDLYKLDGVDFRALPEPPGSIDTVCFDPPYVPQGGTGSDSASAFRDRFGLLEESTPWQATRNLIQDGLANCTRVARRFVLAKCSDFVSGGKFHLGHHWMLDAAESQGWACHDLIVHHTGSGIGGHNIYDPVRARRHHSYLLVFTKGAT